MEPIIYNIKAINDAIEKNANNELARFNITLSQARIIIYLHKSTSKVSLKELEKFFGVSQATIQGTVSRMEKKDISAPFILQVTAEQNMPFSPITGLSLQRICSRQSFSLTKR